MTQNPVEIADVIRLSNAFQYQISLEFPTPSLLSRGRCTALLRLLSPGDNGTSATESACFRQLTETRALSRRLARCSRSINILLLSSHTADIIDLERSPTLPGVVRLRGRQRGRAFVPRRRGDHRDERADRRRQLDGRCAGTGAGETRHVPHQLRAYAAGLTFGKPELVGERL